tara:strand:- start:465 stop:1673 length:1209 start_codon:yes stop_codon:yes gene_type:complete
MATYYVAKAGNDSNNGSTRALAKLTIQNALDSATSADDIVEIVDEGTYNEGNIQIKANSVTIQHTASTLGRPKIHGTGLASNPGTRAFYNDYIGPILKGLEVYGYSGVVMQKGAQAKGMEIEDCFFHSVPKFNSNTLVGTSADPNIIKQSTMFFNGSSFTGPLNDGYLEIENCLITSSATTGDWPLLYDYSTRGTASFCTVINRGDTSKSTMRMSKVINCFVSTSQGMGIASDDQTFNIVCATGGGFAFRNYADGAAAATGTGEQQIDHDEVGFVDGSAIGITAAIAANYNLTQNSTAFNAGTAYNDIFVDITGNLRPQKGYDIGCFELTVPWSDYGFQKTGNTNNGFVIQNYNNLSGNFLFRANSPEPHNPEQVPFSLGVKGPPTLRRFRAVGQKPYKVTK